MRGLVRQRITTANALLHQTQGDHEGTVEHEEGNEDVLEEAEER